MYSNALPSLLAVVATFLDKFTMMVMRGAAILPGVRCMLLPDEHTSESLPHALRRSIILMTGLYSSGSQLA